ncbi:hypothetical protein SKAU_G00292480 [Synaphobranchus kaupii]|uniref:NACHT domain-containing protein n=1 Tax=Synaphobranchus kaupii TaxID=118154 RepID=A0A9Q1IKB5_SYNKA|nr:hypothetical protein SKAU_G00292480 [Synaphobranchus kaupii]
MSDLPPEIERPALCGGGPAGGWAVIGSREFQVPPTGEQTVGFPSSRGVSGLSDMVPFQDILCQVRRCMEEASPEEVRSLLEELMGVQVLSRDYYLLLAQEGDSEDLVRRISLPIWQNWDMCQDTIQPLLHRLPPCRDPESPCADGSEMQEMALDLPEYLGDPLYEEDLSAYFPRELLDIFGECFSPIPCDDGSLDIDKLIQSLCEVQEGSSTKSEPAEQETSDENSSKVKRGLPAYMTSGDPKKAKRRRRVPPVPRKPKSKDRKCRTPKNRKSTVSPEKGVVTAAPPGIVRLGPCTVPQFLHLPVFVPAPGGPSFQVIQAFATVPQQMVNIPVSNTMGPGGPTYVLVPSPAVTPSHQAMPQSPVAGTVVPPDLAVSTPLSSSSDSANKTWSLASGSSQSPVTEVPSCKGSPKSPISQVPPDPVVPKCVEKHIEMAKSLMREMCKNVTAETGVPFKSLYVDVGLVKRQVQVNKTRNTKRCLEKELVVLDDGDRRRATLERGRIFEEGAGQRRSGASIALLGKSGAGKTAFIRRLCLDWADGDLPRFDFLFLLEGRALNVPRGGFSLRNLLFNISANPKLSQDSDVGVNMDAIFRHILGHPQRVLIMFDGFDDFRDYDGLLQSPATSDSRDDYSAKQLFSGLFQKKILAGCSMLVAARAKEVLNQLLGKVDQILELPGFSPTDIELFASRYLAGSPCRDQALKRLRKGGYALRLCANPFLCRSVCYLLDRQDGNKALPSTLTGLCEAVTYHRLRAIGREQEEEGKSVLKLCRVAWEGMKSHNSQLPLQSEQHELAAAGGILTPYAQWHGTEEPTGRGYGFDHTLTQSFLAALHLALSQGVSSRAMVAQMGGQPRKRRLQADWLDATLRLTVALLFQKRALFRDWFVDSGGRARGGTVAGKRVAVTAHLKSLKACELSPAKLLELCHCVFETGDAKLAKWLNKSLPDQLSFSGAQLDPPDVFVLHQLLILDARRSFSLLNLQETAINISGLRELLGLKCVSSFRASIGDVISLWEDLQKTNAEALLRNTISKFTINPFKATRLSHIDDLTLLIQIYREKKLPCDSSQSEPLLDEDAFSIPAVRNLQRLDFELGAQNGPTGFLKLVKILPDLQWLQHLDLEDNKIGDSGAETLAEVLPALSSLEMLNLSQNCIGDGGVAKLTPGLSSLPALLCLSLYSNLIGDGGAQNLATVLPQMKSLTDLDVKYNKFSDSGAMKLSESMRSCPWMKTIGMWNHFIPHGVLERLKQQDPRIRTL